MEQKKDLNYWKNNAEEDYINTPISVLRYIIELEQQVKSTGLTTVVERSEKLVCTENVNLENSKLPILDVRQALIDFLQHMWETEFDRKGLAFDDYVDEYLKSINVA